MQYETLTHTFEPIYDNNSTILILGSFPSVKSRKQQFYYGHPQNRFWKVVAALTHEEVPQTTEQKKKLLLNNHIALWDVIARCDIIGSADSTIKNVQPNDMNIILSGAPIKQIYANGGKAYELYLKYCYPVSEREIIKLPSTSPANAAYGFEKLCEEWQQILRETE